MQENVQKSQKMLFVMWALNLWAVYGRTFLSVTLLKCTTAELCPIQLHALNGCPKNPTTFESFRRSWPSLESHGRFHIRYQLVGYLQYFRLRWWVQEGENHHFWTDQILIVSCWTLFPSFVN